MAIHVNQVGYRPNDVKIAYCTKPIEEFSVMTVDGEVVFTSKAKLGAINDPASGDTLYELDFTSFQQPGTFRLSCGSEHSYFFRIAVDVYDGLKQALLKCLYYQRCGIALEPLYAGVWHHQKCHDRQAKLYPSGHLIDVTGGWHDAGDYGRYIEPGAKAIADLLTAYELFPLAFQEPVNIPESGNGIPDILNEVRYELEWFLKMQDPQTGGVYSKVTASRFPAMIMPEADVDQLYVYGFSTTAAADFVAVMAMAARIYQQFDAQFSAICLEAARRAWAWLTVHNNTDYPSLAGQSLETGTGGYGDRHDVDERYWAAAEMLRTTHDQKYHHYFADLYHQNFDKYEYTWNNVAGYGTIAYLRTPQKLVDPDLYQELLTGFLRRADAWCQQCTLDGYGISLKPEDYVWGSNGVVMDRAMHLLIANSLQANQEYVQAAQAHLHYLLGRNPMGICYVTGFGTNSVQHPHHRPSQGDAVVEPVPGMVAGGPNCYLQDEISRVVFQNRVLSVPPAKRYLDHVESYATNEMTVYWNSPAVLVAAFFTL